MKQLFAFLLAGIVSVASAQTPVIQIDSASAKADNAVEQFTLDNGLTVIVKTDRRAPIAAHMLWVRVGAMDEVDGTSGVAHALEHMMFKGTPAVPAGEFSTRVAALGGNDNAFTTLDSTTYFQQIPSHRLEDVMRLESDRFAHNQWPDEDFAREMEVIKEERRMRTDDNPRAVLHEQLNAVAFIANPYRRPVIGWMDDLDSMTASDVRQFFRQWYVPTNAALIVAGDVDVAEVRRLAEKYYGDIPSRAMPVRKPRKEPEQKGLRRMEVKAQAEQAYVALAYRVPGLQSLTAPSPQDEDALALTVLSAVLDGYSGARLERALTQGPDRVADSVGAYHNLMARGPKLFYLSGVPAQGKSAAQVEAALRYQVARIAREGVDKDELQRVKTQWIANEVYKRDALFSQANALGQFWVLGMPLDADARLIARLRGISAQQVQDVAAKYFGDDRLSVATLIPQPPDGSQAHKPGMPMQAGFEATVAH